MIAYYKKVFPLTLGTFLSLVCIVSLVEAVRLFSFSYVDDWLPQFLVAVVFGFTGLPIFFWGLERFGKDNK